MKVQTVLALGAVLTLCVASDALAQRGGGRGGMFGGVSRMGLLRIEKVQEAIKLTDEQQQKAEDARDELRQARGGRGGQGFQDLSPEERR
jgi:Spy/CpxP family protein refolding chaperone